MQFAFVGLCCSKFQITFWTLKANFPQELHLLNKATDLYFQTEKILHDKENIIPAAFPQATASVKKRKELSEKFCFSKLSLQRCRLIFG